MKRNQRLGVLILCSLALLLWPFSLSAVTLEEYVTPTQDSSPNDVAFAPDGMLWFTMIHANKIGRLDPSKVKPGTSEGITEFDVPHGDSRPNYITVAQDGTVWFTEMLGNRISKIDPATGAYTGYDIPTPNSEPHRAVEGEQGGIWFLEFDANKVGRLDPKTGEIREYEVGDGHPHGIARVGPYIWYTKGGKFFAKLFFNKVGRLDTRSGEIKEITVPPRKSVPHGMGATSDGTVWFTKMFVSQIARMHKDGEGYDEFPMGDRRGPHDVKVDEKRGWVWITLSHPDAIGRLDLAKAQPGTENGLESFPIPKGSHARQMALAPDGSVWFAYMGHYFRGKYDNKIGRIIP